MAARRNGIVIPRAEPRDAEALCAVMGAPGAQAAADADAVGGDVAQAHRRPARKR